MTDGDLKVPAWLEAAIDQRLALMREAMGEGTLQLLEAGYLKQDVLMTPLTEPREGATEAEMVAWDFTCDRCGTLCLPPAPFYTGHRMLTWHGARVCITFGTCQACYEESQ